MHSQRPFHAAPLMTSNDVEYATMATVDSWNSDWFDSTLRYVPPAEYETARDHQAVTNQLVT